MIEHWEMLDFDLRVSPVEDGFAAEFRLCVAANEHGVKWSDWLVAKRYETEEEAEAHIDLLREGLPMIASVTRIEYDDGTTKRTFRSPEGEVLPDERGEA